MSPRLNSPIAEMWSDWCVTESVNRGCICLASPKENLAVPQELESGCYPTDWMGWCFTALESREYLKWLPTNCHNHSLLILRSFHLNALNIVWWGEWLARPVLSKRSSILYAGRQSGCILALHPLENGAWTAASGLLWDLGVISHPTSYAELHSLWIWAWIVCCPWIPLRVLVS